MQPDLFSIPEPEAALAPGRRIDVSRSVDPTTPGSTAATVSVVQQDRRAYLVRRIGEIELVLGAIEKSSIDVSRLHQHYVEELGPLKYELWTLEHPARQVAG